MPAKRDRAAERRPTRQPTRGRTDWSRVDATTDDEIAAQIAGDPDTAPEWTAETFARAELVIPQKKVPISFRVDPDVLTHYKSKGPGYQSRMNAVLRSYMEYEQLERTARAPGRTRRSTPASAPSRSARRGEGK
jgi:uncharacterized protein (DUF4415 family)